MLLHPSTSCCSCCSVLLQPAKNVTLVSIKLPLSPSNDNQPRAQHSALRTTLSAAHNTQRRAQQSAPRATTMKSSNFHYLLQTTINPAHNTQRRAQQSTSHNNNQILKLPLSSHQTTSNHWHLIINIACRRTRPSTSLFGLRACVRSSSLRTSFVVANTHAFVA